MQRNESGETPAEVLRGRIQRRCEAKECRLRIRRAKSLPATGLNFFPSQTFYGCVSDLVHKCHRRRERGVEPLASDPPSMWRSPTRPSK